MILKETIDKVESATNIVEVIEDFVQLKKSGANYKGLSPFSNERTPSFMVSPEKQIFKDFSSGKGGGAINFIMEIEHLNYPEAIRYLANKYNIEVLETALTDSETIEKQSKEALIIINEAATDFYVKNLMATQDLFETVKTSRVFSSATMNKFAVGFSPNTIAQLATYLVTQSKFNWEYCVQTSLLGFKDGRVYDRFRNRLMFPIKNIHGKVIGFGGRDIDWKKGSESPKYLNSSDSLVYNKSEVLYGIFESRRPIAENDMAYLVEGYTDVMGFHEIGIENIVGASGTALTQEQAGLINKLTKNVTVIFDSDSPGIKASLRGIDVLLMKGMNVKICLLPSGEDPDSFRKGKTKEQVLDYIFENSKDFIVFKLEYLLKDVKKDDFQKVSNAVTEIVASIAKVSNPIQREVYLKECSRITSIDISALRMMLDNIPNIDIDFFEVPEDFTVQNNLNSRMFLLEQCEKKIIQHLLINGDEVFEFKDLVLEHDGFEVVDSQEIQKLTAREKIVKEITDDGLQFTNLKYSMIYNKAITADLSKPENWQELFGAELALTCMELRDEAQGSTLSSFESEGVKTYEYIMRDKHINTKNSIAETLLFFKFLNVENIVDEEMKKPEVDVDFIFELMNLSSKIKTKLNII